MGIAVGRRIDQKEQAFTTSRVRIDVVTILGANISGWACGHCAVLEDSLKLCAVVIRKEYGVSMQGKSISLRKGRKGHGRQRPCCRLRTGGFQGPAKQACCRGGGI